MNRNIPHTLAATLVVGIASLSLAGAAQAGTPVTTTFSGSEGTDLPAWATGPVGNQFGWKSSGLYDHEITEVAGNNMLRVSNAKTNSSFGDMTFSKPVLKPAGENEAANVLVNQFTIKTASATEQPGLSLSVSPDDDQGTRLSYLRFDDKADGVHVTFADYNGSDFVYQDIATLDHAVTYTIKFETTFVHGHDNDVVKVFINDVEKVRGGSWEGYYRFIEERNPSNADRLLIRTAGTAAPDTAGNGFLFDDVTSQSYHVDNPAPLHPVAIPQGPKGDQGDDGAKGDTGSNGVDGKSGVNGVDGVTTIIREQVNSDSGKLVGDKLRALHVSVPKGAKFLAVNATLRGKRLPAHGRTIKVDLRNQSVGSYNVTITAKYAKGGKTFIVKSTRNLSVHTTR